MGIDRSWTPRAVNSLSIKGLRRIIVKIAVNIYETINAMETYNFYVFSSISFQSGPAGQQFHLFRSVFTVFNSLGHEKRVWQAFYGTLERIKVCVLGFGCRQRVSLRLSLVTLDEKLSTEIFREKKILLLSL